jgi:hypothetical protein
MIPESCAVGREVEGEALTGVRAGRPWSREILNPRCRHPWTGVEGNTACTDNREVHGDRARSENPCMHVSTRRGSRETSWSPEVRASGRKGKSKDAIR